MFKNLKKAKKENLYNIYGHIKSIRQSMEKWYHCETIRNRHSRENIKNHQKLLHRHVFNCKSKWRIFKKI